ncbi:transcription regulator bdf1 [Seiridium cupressi]
MATEQPQTISVDQKINGVTLEKDKMAVDEPVAKAVNGHTTSEDAPAANGKSPSPERAVNHQAFAANSGLSAQSPSESAKGPVVEDSETKDVNGSKEVASPDASVTKDVSAVQAPASPPQSATPKAPTADDSMDVDTSTERPDLSSSAEHVGSTQTTSNVSDNVGVASPQEMSQSADVAKLDIKSPDLDLQDVPMPDRATSPAKISRERSFDEDAADEPSAKRTKLASQNDKPLNPETVKVGDTIGVASVFSPAPDGEVDNLVDDVPDDQPIKEYHSKEIRKELARVKKTKNGMNFRQSVEKLWPDIWENYKALIDNPVDLAMFESKFRDNKYATFGDFKTDLRLLYENSLKYNGTANVVSVAAFRVRNDLFAKISEVSKLQEPAKSDKNKIQPTRHVESRAATQPRRQSHSQSGGTATSPKPKVEPAAAPSAVSGTPVSASAPAFALPPNGVPQIRRDSTRDDGDRPKRPIHPPKNRDPDYGLQNARKKKLEPEMKFYAGVLDDLKKQKYWNQNQWFLEPVDPVALNIPNYFHVIKKPMDLKTMTEKLEDGKYRSGKDVEKDMHQILANSELFNGVSLVTNCAQELETLFKEKIAEKENWMAKNYPPSAPSVSASAPSPEASDLDSDAESEAEVDESSESVRNVQSRLLEEQSKLNDMLSAKKPDMTMIEIQQNVVSMLQRKLVEEKSKSGSTKKAKPPKKPVSKAKAKSGASQSITAATSKKSSGANISSSKNRPANSKKPQTKKRVIGQLEKTVITEGIGELDGPTLDKAVDIIKKDTHQKEDDDGQLELDIEVLSQDALVRLFELINRAYPNIYASVSKRPEYTKKDEQEQSPAQSANPSKPRKNKPMNKDEQERKIEQLRELKAQFQRQGSGSQEPAPEDEEQGDANTSGSDSDSEEE